MTNTKITKKEGWAYIPENGWHYFKKGISLCRKWLTWGKPKYEQGKDHCKECEEVLKK